MVYGGCNSLIRFRPKFITQYIEIMWKNGYIILSQLLLCNLGPILGHDQVSLGSFPWLITLCRSILSLRGQKRLILPQPEDIEEEGQCLSADRHWLKK